MYPTDLPAMRIPMPQGDRESIAIITGGTLLHHAQFVGLVESRFPGLTKVWFALAPQSNASSSESLIGRMRTTLRDGGVRAFFKRYAKLSKVAGYARAWASRSRPSSARALLGDYPRAMEAMFPPELRFSAPGRLEPTIVASPNAPAVVERLRELRPYFLLILGGPLVSGEVLRHARGFALNVHAGWSPDLRGSRTTEQALYHRRTDWVGATVHIATTAADAGPILRRSLAALYDDDTPAECFFRVVALGHHLMAHVVGELLTTNEAIAYDQSGRGTTVRVCDFGADRGAALARDIEGGWLSSALADERRY